MLHKYLWDEHMRGVSQRWWGLPEGRPDGSACTTQQEGEVKAGAAETNISLSGWGARGQLGYRHLGCFSTLAIVNNAAINVCVQVFVLTYIFTSLGYIPRNGIAKSFRKKKYMYIVSMRLCAHECMCLYTNTILLSIFISVIMTQRDGMGRDVGSVGQGSTGSVNL